MSVLSVQNLQETFVGKHIARVATQITNPNAAGYPVDGEVVIVNSSGVVGTTTNTTYALSPWIQIVQRNGDNLVWSNKIYGNKLTSYRGKTFTAGQDQIYHIGYNGTTGSLDVNSGLDFMLTVIENQDDMMWSEQKKKSVVFVPSNLVTTQLSLAKAIVSNQMKKYMIDGSSITAVMLNDGGAGAAFTGAATVAVTHGSNIIVPNALITNAGFGAGSVIRIGTTGSGLGASVPVYTVQGPGPIANSWILDQPYAGPSNAALAVANAGIITPGTNWGVRFTGKTLPFRRDFFKFKRVSFTLQMSGFGATLLSKTQDALYGSGDGRLVLEEESFSKGFEGALNRMTVPLPLANETFTADGSVSSTVGATGAATISNGSAYTATGQYLTITTAAAHGFVTGQVVLVAGTTAPAGFNGTYTIVNVPSTTTFTVVNSTVAAGTGTTTTAGTATPGTVGSNGDTFPVSNSSYAVLTLEHFGQDTATVVQPPTMPQLVKVAMPVGASQGTIPTGAGSSAVQAVLNTWANGTPGAYPNLAIM